LGCAFGMDANQYTPDPADWSTFYSKPLSGEKVTGHDPDSIGWLQSWPTWDGTIYNPSKMTKSEFSNAICPHVDTILGIREVFYEHNPFANNTNPKKAEVDEWHRIAINHVRALIGYTSEDRKIKKDQCMFARSLWGQQRKSTTMWDTKYPDGICEEGSSSHCGHSFIPDAADQVAYLPAGHSPCFKVQGAEGIFSGPKSNIPWSVKFSRAFCITLMQEGFWGGHTGPWFHREKFGFSFWDPDANNKQSNAVLRAKWTGKRMKSTYCNPTDEDCDIESTGPPDNGDTTSTASGDDNGDTTASGDDNEQGTNSLAIQKETLHWVILTATLLALFGH